MNNTKVSVHYNPNTLTIIMGFSKIGNFSHPVTQTKLMDLLLLLEVVGLQ